MTLQQARTAFTASLSAIQPAAASPIPIMVPSTSSKRVAQTDFHSQPPLRRLPLTHNINRIIWSGALTNYYYYQLTGIA